MIVSIEYSSSIITRGPGNDVSGRNSTTHLLFKHDHFRESRLDDFHQSVVLSVGVLLESAALNVQRGIDQGPSEGEEKDVQCIYTG